jgi:hypothetical protein
MFHNDNVKSELGYIVILATIAVGGVLVTNTKTVLASDDQTFNNEIVDPSYLKISDERNQLLNTKQDFDNCLNYTQLDFEESELPMMVFELQ